MAVESVQNYRSLQAKSIGRTGGRGHDARPIAGPRWRGRGVVAYVVAADGFHKSGGGSR
ncbi:MAG: hypothetical protein ABJE94_13950 [Parasphingorhabdus sp.]|uniref:hypothetical protein n=1 Tax=Parasphingorhabdus sp. TaxID=2709688 RepID=UPI003263FA50